LLGIKKGLYICALVSGTLADYEKSSRVVLMVFLRGLKNNFNFFSKKIVGKKKSIYICTRLRDKRLKKFRKSS